jgi:hypothetical protein
MNTNENEQIEKVEEVNHPQAWLREKYGKSEKKKKDVEDILFYKLYSKPLETPEDVKRYREERLRNYPTKKNIEKKLELESKKKERGELVPKVEKFKGRKKKNLLNQLIESEMNREKNCILQSLRFIVQNEFYCQHLSTRVKKRLQEIPKEEKIEKTEQEEMKEKLNNLHEEIELLDSEGEDEEEEEQEEEEEDIE